MRDEREDQLLCPTHYRPVEAVTPSRRFTRYLCPHCPEIYRLDQLVRASELSKMIEEVGELPLEKGVRKEDEIQ